MADMENSYLELLFGLLIQKLEDMEAEGQEFSQKERLLEVIGTRCL